MGRTFLKKWKRSRSADQLRVIAQVFGLHGEDDSGEFSGDMSKGNAMELASGSFFSIILGKDWLVGNKRQTTVHKSISELRRIQPFFKERRYDKNHSFRDGFYYT